MTILIYVRREGDRHVARSRFPEVEAGCFLREQAIHFVRGTCLIAIGSWRTVPETIEFSTVRVFG